MKLIFALLSLLALGECRRVLGVSPLEWASWSLYPARWEPLSVYTPRSLHPQSMGVHSLLGEGLEPALLNRAPQSHSSPVQPPPGSLLGGVFPDPVPFCSTRTFGTQGTVTGSLCGRHMRLREDE